MLFVILKLSKIPSDIGVVETVTNNSVANEGLLGFIQSMTPDLTQRFY